MSGGYYIPTFHGTVSDDDSERTIREIGRRRREIRCLPPEFDRTTLAVRHHRRETYRRLKELGQPMKEACQRQEFFLRRQKDLYRRKNVPCRERANDFSSTRKCLRGTRVMGWVTTVSANRQ
jgi:hypothetical protein